MDSPIIINCVRPLSFLGVLGVIFNVLSHFSMNYFCANRIAPDGTPRSVASHLGLCCLPMSHKRDARLKRVNVYVHMYVFFFGIRISPTKMAISQNLVFKYFFSRGVFQKIIFKTILNL